MSQGRDPTSAAQNAIYLISSFFPDVSAAMVTVNVEGDHGKFV